MEGDAVVAEDVVMMGADPGVLLLLTLSLTLVEGDAVVAEDVVMIGADPGVLSLEPLWSGV